MTLDNRISEIATKEIRNGGFSGSHQVKRMNEKPHISGSINTNGFNRIEIGYNPDYDNEQLLIMVRDVSRHEVNHRRYNGFNGCPRNLEYHVEKIYGPIADVLKEKDFSSADAHYIANALEDSILHSDLSGRFALDGISEAFSDVGESSENNQYTLFYDAHVKLNMFLWGNKRQKRQLKRYFVHNKEKQKKIAKVVQDFLKKSGLKEIGRDRHKVRAFLNDKDNWQKIARAYAEEFSELMEHSYAMPLFNHSGKGTKGREVELPRGLVEGNEFDREMETEEYKIKRIQRAYDSEDKTPSLMDSFESLDLLYQSFARKLNLKVETYTESEQRPVYWYGQRPFDPENDNLKNVTFEISEEGRIELRKRRYSEAIDIPHKISPKGFPETRFCLMDTSGSMAWSPDGNAENTGRKGIIPWGDNSRYHYALLGWYGLLEYLKQNHLLNQTEIGFGNFSGETRISKGLEDAKRNALSPQFGITQIESGKISEIFSGNGNLVYTISDGEIGNWNNIRNEFIKGAKNHYYFHLQIGPVNEMNRNLTEKGLNVVEIHNAQDLAEKVIEITDNNFRGEEK